MFGRKVARRYGIRNYPSLTFFRGGDPEAFDGNALRSDDVVAFLTNPDALELPDKIEVVRADALFKIIRKEEQVAVLFYDDKVSGERGGELSQLTTFTMCQFLLMIVLCYPFHRI